MRGLLDYDSIEILRYLRLSELERVLYFQRKVLSSMTDQQIMRWLRLLSSNPAKQKRLVLDLLHYAKEDGMAKEDLVDCRRALMLLEEEEAKERLKARVR